MNPITMESTVGALVVDRPSRSRVFSKLGIDYCCGGKLTLAEACEQKRLSPNDVVALLEADAAPEPRSEWAEAPLPALTVHLVDRHHVFTRGEIARLLPMLDKVARVHGERHPYMIEVASVFRRFSDEMLVHMLKEERVLFPAIVALSKGEPAMSVSMPIQMMNTEHEAAGADFEELRELTHGFVTPKGGCNTFRAALDGLEQLEADLHQHVHLESNVLFPRALERMNGCCPTSGESACCPTPSGS